MEIKEAIKEIRCFYGENLHSKDAGIVTRATRTLLEFAELALDKTEKEWGICEASGGGYHVHYKGSFVAHITELPYLWNEPNPSPVKVPEKFKGFRGDHATYLLAKKIEDLIDWAKGVEGRIK